MQDTTANPATIAYGWGALSRVNLQGAGRNLGRYTVPASQVRGYTESIVRDGCAEWVSPDTIQLTELGWSVFYAISGWSSDYYSATHQAGVAR